MFNISQVCHSKCSGCGTCFNKCPIGAIQMLPDKEGFLMPVINEDKCTNCGLCAKVCPILNERNSENLSNPKCYAVMASDEIRAKSSSGGMFTLLAEQVLSKGGYVCGASYNQDLSVSHIIVDNKEDLSRLRGSKYLQSSIEKCFVNIKKLLNQGNQVLFSGTPCQVAGLNSFLGKPYDNLLTVELLCHGTPSYKVFRKYLDENFDISKIKRVDFRDKSVKWRSDYLTIELESGEIIQENIDVNSFEQGFHAGLFNRKSCAPCQFAKLPRQADVTIADWWGIKDIDIKLDDTKGTSLVLVNNKKAERVFADLKNEMLKVQEISLKKAKKSVNKTIYKPLKEHIGREMFFKNFDNLSFKKNVEMSLNNKFDVGIIGLWYGNNYGCILTGYALYKLAEQLGYSTAFIDIRRLKKGFDETEMVRRFTNDLNVVAVDNDETNSLNYVFDKFLVGSDQVWNYNLTLKHTKYFLLDFAQDNRLKIAYASSFGKTFDTYGNDFEMELCSHFINRFDAISLRENYAPAILKEKTGINSVQVLDPVFVCQKSVYEDLIYQSKVDLSNEDYIFAYILDPNEEKNKFLEYVANKMNKQLYVVTDATNNAEKVNKISVGKVLPDLDLQDWLNYYKNASYVLTDSFHGSCFSIIFEKDFITTGNLERGIERFYSLLGDFDLTDRLITSLEGIESRGLLSSNIDYKKVNSIIAEKKEFSYNWLKDSLLIEKDKWLSDLDMTKWLLSIYSKPEDFYKRNYRLNKILYQFSFGKLRRKNKLKMKHWKSKLNEYRKYKGLIYLK